MREPCRERGFTIIELMVVVAIVAVLAAVVVPAFTREAARTKGKTEVVPMFAEIAIKEEQYKNEASPTSTYLSAPVCPATPALPSASYDFVSCLTGNWLDLRINAPSQKKMYCTYYVEAGTSTDALVVPADFTALVPATASGLLATSWFYIVAECDESGNAGTNTKYYKSSVDTKIYTVNEGS